MQRGLALAAIALGGAYLALVLSMRVGDVEDPVGPRMFPLMIAIGILLTGIAMWFEPAGKPAAAPAAPIDDAERALRRNQAIAVAGVAAGAVAFMLLMQPLGFFTVATLLMLGMLTAFNRGRHGLNVAVAVGVSAVLYIGLKRYLGVALPSGILPF